MKKKGNDMSTQTDKRIEGVKKDTVCPSCPEDNYVTTDELVEDVEQVNLDENTRDRG